MKAVVLTCDRYHAFTGHMISSYNELWPQHPFKFLIPYQTYPSALAEKHGPMAEFVPSPKSIMGTFHALLDHLPDDDEWIYWCIDDKYPIWIDTSVANDLLHWLPAASNTVSGVLMCRCRGLNHSANLLPWRGTKTPGGVSLLRRRNILQIWIHQFVRVKTIRWLCKNFPDRDFSAKEMDHFLSPNGHILEFPKEMHLYVTKYNYCIFGESTSRGKITRNCLQSFHRTGLPSPEFQVLDQDIIMGRRPDWLNRLSYFARPFK